MLQTYKTRLIQKIQLTEDVFLYKFDLIEPKELVFLAGQYLIMMVPDSTTVTSRYSVNGAFTLDRKDSGVVRRLYSVASAPQDKTWFELMVKIIPDGVAGKYFANMKINDEVTFQGPAGIFTLRENQNNKVFLVTGTCLAPVRSMLKEISNLKFQISNFYLFWGLPYYKDVCLFEELKSLTMESRRSKIGVEDGRLKVDQNQSSPFYSQPLSSMFNYLPSSFQFKIFLSREANLDMVADEDKKYFQIGRVTDGLNKLILNSEFLILNSDFYLCSKPEIVDSLKNLLEQKGAIKEQVYFEKF